jgi:hypothetical protein
LNRSDIFGLEQISWVESLVLLAFSLVSIFEKDTCPFELVVKKAVRSVSKKVFMNLLERVKVKTMYRWLFEDVPICLVVTTMLTKQR